MLAREFGRTILPVLLEPNARSALVADVQEVRWVPANGHVAEQRLVDALRKLTLDPRFALPWNGSKSPYPGLHPFEEDRAGVFYGRDPEIARVLQRLTGPRGDTSERFVVVVGASGSGKSSLGARRRAPAAAGGQRGRGSSSRQSSPARRRSTDSRTLSLVRAAAPSPRAAAASGSRPASFRRSSASSWERGDGGGLRGGVVITIDQAEKLALDPGTQRVELLDGLVAALDASPSLHVVATLREEYLTRVTAGTLLGGRPMTTIPLEPLSSERLLPTSSSSLPSERGSVSSPASSHKWSRRRPRASPPAATRCRSLPFTLERLFDSRGERSTITVDDYRRVGGVAGALRAEADAVYERLAQTRGADAVVGTLLELGALGGGRSDSPAARTVARERFDADESGRRAGVRRGAAPDGRRRGAECRPSRTKPSCATGPCSAPRSRSDRDRLVARTRLERAAKEWNAGGRKVADLLAPERLKVARRVAADDPAWASDDVLVSFLAASRRHVRRSRATTFAVAAAIVLAAAGPSPAVRGLRTTTCVSSGASTTRWESRCRVGTVLDRPARGDVSPVPAVRGGGSLYAAALDAGRSPVRRRARQQHRSGT